jgi:hypothetical protein
MSVFLTLCDGEYCSTFIRIIGLTFDIGNGYFSDDGNVHVNSHRTNFTSVSKNLFFYYKDLRLANQENTNMSMNLTTKSPDTFDQENTSGEGYSITLSLAHTKIAELNIQADFLPVDVSP